MTKDLSTGSAIIGMGVFSLYSVWSGAAPSLTEVRETPPGSVKIKNQLLDASILTGGIATLVGSLVYVMTGEAAPGILMVVTFIALAFWWYQVAQAEGHG